ncbi:hypothetical protein I4U23_012970 [Adineta vaga]|nr:hypothetical protein I4U23_012970 [Adineta vaga]
MHSTACYIQHSNDYPSVLSSVHNHLTQVSVENDYNTSRLDLSSSIYLNQSKSDENQHRELLSNSFNETRSTSGIPMKRRPRLVPVEEKDESYYDKRARNNESAKRSRDTRRMKEQEIQDRAQFLQQENSRLAFENQTIRYQLSQLHLFYNGISKPIQ